ncbi:MAG: ribosomal L7Ae/L30e/S12e/Gadd45 family protein [Nanoarchaeota archaeon]|nr:ribosomal L7Ae/L30e/S12e/Gadd45 family protein [Nanoarchaeota archaeon]
MSLQELKRALKEEQLVYGTDRTIKNLKLGKTHTVFLAKNCPENVRTDLAHYKKIQDFTIHELEEPSDELALICKKKFHVSVLSF